MKNRVWLSSYPKSGNTWLRVLLESILYNNGELVDINQISITSNTSIKRQDFNAYLGIESSDLTLEETMEYKRTFLLESAKNDKKRRFVKTHDGNLLLASGLNLFPSEITELAIQVVRNPLDIVSSLANHLGISNDQSIQQLNSFNYYSTEKRSYFKCTSQLYSESLSWSNHINSWVKESAFPVYLVKYEDLSLYPDAVLKKLLLALGEDIEDSIINKAVENNSFETLSNLEKKGGFIEKSPFSSKFFRQGKVDAWKEELNQQQINRVISDHEEVMTKMGYL